MRINNIEIVVDRFVGHSPNEGQIRHVEITNGLSSVEVSKSEAILLAAYLQEIAKNG